MKDGNEPHGDGAAKKPQQQTEEECGTIKRSQLDDRNAGERADVARGSETETRAAASRRS